MAYLENVTLRITTIVATFWATLGKIATFYSFINGPFTASFSLFLCFQYSLFAQLKVNKIANNWIRFTALWCLEVTAQPTAPQPMPRVIFIFDSTKISIRSKSVSLLVFVVVVVFDQFR